MQAGTLFAHDLLMYGHVDSNTAEQRRCSFESSGGISAPSSVPNASPTPQNGSLGLVDEQTSAHFVFLPVKFGDLIVSALVDSGAMHNSLPDSCLPKLQDSPSFISIVPCQLQCKVHKTLTTNPIVG